ncbi:MAG: TadE/TadG family type IV pilus assembly protein [Methylococcales bacterium]|nr:TadE/TadG family type IV pilus assembly protein [Methylococcales bacterium]
MINKHKQKGAETVEFAMIAVLFFAFLFAIIEFSRALFAWNALTEATRRGARMAVICPYESDIPAKVAIFDVIAGSLGTSPIIAGLTPDMVNVSYYLADGVTPTADQTLIKFVEVKITDFTHTLFIPLWGGTITAPEFKTTLPSESLGAVPTYPGEDPIDPDCSF